MSHRNLTFFKNQVSCGFPLNISKRKEADAHSLQCARWLDLHQYANLSNRYNHRLISFQSDAVNAFAAVIQVLSRSFSGGFIHGLSEFFFDYALMWAPIFRPDKRSHAFPSWSWLSHAGDIGYLYYNVCDQMLAKQLIGWRRMEPSVELTPLVRWHKVDATTGEIRKINNSYNTHQLMRHDSSSVLPPGWMRQKFRQPMWKGPTGSEEDILCLKHEDVQPWGTLFIYPVPIIQEPFEVTTASWSSQLKYSSKIRNLIIGSVLPDFTDVRAAKVSTGTPRY